MQSSREQDFHHLVCSLRSAVQDNCSELSSLLSRMSAIIEMYAIPNPVTSLPSFQSIDYNALNLKPTDAPEDLVPTNCTGNGNCLFNAASILLCGKETMATELRVRTAVALIQLQEEFTNPSNDAIRQLVHEQAVLYSPFGEKDHSVTRDTINDNEVNMVFKDELLTTLTDGAWSGMWQFIGLATALQMPILSIYPQYNLRQRSLFNKIVQPLIHLEQTMFVLPIMWTGFIQNSQFHPNHFVPLVPTQFFIHNSVPVCTLNGNLNCDFKTPGKRTHSYIDGSLEFTYYKNYRSEDYEAHQKDNDKSNSKNYLSFTSSFRQFCAVCEQRLLNIRPKIVDLKAVCSTCFKYVNNGEVSPLDKLHMFPGNIPIFLMNLNRTEKKIISQIHPYMNMVCLPSGGQYGLQGQSINIPISVQTLCLELPRTCENFPYVKIFSAKRDTYCEIVNIRNINKALDWLKMNNKFYSDVNFIPFCDEMDLNCIGNLSSGFEENIEMQEISFVPSDYQFSNSLDEFPNYPEFKMPIMKGEPINIFNSLNLEELAFPYLYPYGTHGLRYNRPHQPTISQYFKCRLLNKDYRWSSSPQYMFWALHVFEQHKLQDAISIALRKKMNAAITVEDVKNTIDISNKTDNYMFMKNLRGTAAYWKSELSKLMAKIRSLGPPTFFMSLSANDIHWIDNLKFINPMLSNEDIEKMSSAEKMKLIKENPIASSIHFNNRWEAFLKHFLLEKPYPLGHIMDYFARIEFQVRGSPHLHILLWIADAPNFENENERDYIVPFLDKYISAKIPDETDQKLRFLVTSLQTHCHTMSCQRYKKVLCRYDFPMPISEKTRLKTELDTGLKSRFYLLQRSEEDIFVNAYNKDVLENWEANMDLQLIGSMYGVAKYVCAYICKNEPFEFRQKILSCIQKLPENSTQRKLLSKIGNILLTHRTIGLQETAYRILGLNMVYSSREAIYVDVNIPDKRYRILKSKKELDQLSQGSVSIYYDGLAQYYLYRPYNDVFENMCLAEFVTKYKTTSTVPKTSKGMPRYTLDIPSEKKLIMQRSKLACLQCYIPDILKDEEGYYYSLLYLFLPFRNESQILIPCKTYMDAFRQKKGFLNQQLLQLTNLSKKFDNAVKHLLSLDHDQLEDIMCVAAPSNEQLNDVALEEGVSKIENIFSFDIMNEEKEKNDSESDFNMEMFKKLAYLSMTEEEYQEKILLLSSSQKQVFDYVQKHSKGMNQLTLFITGGAGTGKSFLLCLLKEYFLRQNAQEFPNVLVAAPTGVAAFNISGHTLHTLLQLPTQDKANAKYRRLSPKSYKLLSDTFKYVQCLIIDEISMVSYNTLEHIHLRLNEIKGHYLDTDTYFGNIHIIAFGDLYQLPPVYGSAIFADTACTTPFHLWKDFFQMFELLENKRQSKDPEYAALLNRIRTGNQTKKDIEILSSRVVTTEDVSKLLHIFPVKKDRDIHNAKLVRLSNESEEIIEINAIHNVPEKFIPDDDQKCAGLPKTLVVCKNARVMLIRNIDTTGGLVNGAQGTVHSIEWTKEEKNMPRCINVLFDNQNILPGFQQRNDEPVGIKPLSVTFLGNHQTYVTRCQIPLVLSFASTIHKVQGLSLENAVCDIGPSIFRGGMAYVALSRVSTMQGLFLKRLCPPRLYTSSTICNEMARLREKSVNM